MKTLKEIRIQNNYRPSHIVEAIGISYNEQKKLESGRSYPSKAIRLVIESFYGEKINFLTSAPFTNRIKKNPIWNRLEPQFIRLTQEINALPEDEIIPFCDLALKHIRNLKKTKKKAQIRACTGI